MRSYFVICSSCYCWLLPFTVFLHVYRQSLTVGAWPPSWGAKCSTNKKARRPTSTARWLTHAPPTTGSWGTRHGRARKTAGGLATRPSVKVRSCDCMALIHLQKQYFVLLIIFWVSSHFLSSLFLIPCWNITFAPSIVILHFYLQRSVALTRKCQSWLEWASHTTTGDSPPQLREVK